MYDKYDLYVQFVSYKSYKYANLIFTDASALATAAYEVAHQQRPGVLAKPPHLPKEGKYGPLTEFSKNADGRNIGPAR